jgi:NADH-quinone oxidoreductase subunit C
MSTWSSRLPEMFPKAQWLEAGGFGPALIFPDAHALPEICQKLRSDPAWEFSILEDYTALDLGTGFMLVLHLVSPSDRTRQLTVKTQVPRDKPQAPSLHALFGSALWYEREIFDMFGIVFSGHPDLRRILLPEDWVGYPLRKDYTDDRILKRPGA